MNDELREILADEMELHYCPIANQYMGCDNECEECKDYIEFCECVMEDENND